MENKTEALFVNRISFLKPAEKKKVYDYLIGTQKKEEELNHFLLSEIETIIERKVRSKQYKSQLLYELAKRDTSRIEKGEIGCVVRGSTEYPAKLEEIYDPPLVLYTKGKPQWKGRKWVAIVGTRSPSRESCSAAFSLAEALAAKGVGVISGLARGIDSYAHAGALKGNGLTAAVFGCGIDTIYPSFNKQLAAQMIGNGGFFLSEYSPGVAPLQFQFPQRNRIISGLADLVVLMEAPVRSGALITADYALEQGREVVVHRSAVATTRGDGTKDLAAQGAEIVESAEDICRLLPA